jgi:hypothetical protein
MWLYVCNCRKPILHPKNIVVFQSHKSMKRIFTLLISIMIVIATAQGQVAGDFRSKTAGPGNWNDFNAWETYDGATWVPALSGQLPLSSSAVEIRSGHTININAAGLTSGNLTVTGALTYDAVAVSALTVTGNVTVAGTGSFTSPASGSVVTHALNITGNLTVNGVFDMNIFASAGVVTTFTGATNNSISGSGTTINFYSLVVNKGTTNANILDVTSVITIAPPQVAGMRLTITNGTFKLSSASILTPYNGTQTLLSTNGKLWINNAGASVQNVGAGTVTGVGRAMITTGTLQITAGTFGYGSGSDIHSFAYSSTYLVLDGPNAVLNIYGSMQMAYGLNFTMSAGNINIYPQAANILTGYPALSMESYFLITTNYQFTGGMITIVDPPAPGSSVNALTAALSNGTYNMSGGTIRFGDGVSDKDGGANGFAVNSNAPIGTMIVNNSTSSTKTNRYVKLVGATTVSGVLTINSGVANQFLLNGYALNLAGNIVNSGTFTGDGAGGNTIVFNGTTQQTVSGSGVFTNSNINNITMNNTSGASPAVDLQKSFSVSNNLTLTNGSLGSTNSSVLTLGRSASSAAMTIIRSGGSLSLTTAYALSGVTLTSVTYNAPVPAAAITTGGELPPAVPITTFTINNVTGVTLNKPVSCTTLALTAGILTAPGANTVTVTGTAPANITGGSATAYVNGALTRTLPNNAVAANYKFPIGKTAYRLFEFETITTAGTGTASITAEAFDTGPYPGSPGVGMGSINTDKMWKLSGSLGTVTVTASKIRITESGLINTNRIGQSNIALGSYNNAGGSIGTGTISTTKAIDYSNLATGTYFRIGFVGPFPSGLYAIGPFGPYAGYDATYATFQAASDAVADVTFTGNVVFEFQPDYLPSVETYPVILPTGIVGNPAATITFRPSPAVGSVINFSSTGNVVTCSGADYIILDGRKGGAGTGRFMQFTSTGVATPAITMSNDALNNKFYYCVFKGSNTGTSSGIVLITTPGATGNSFYTFDNCNFDGSVSASNCLYATGLGANATITNCNFFDYKAGGGINLASGSDNCIIDNNNFYQTTVYSAAAGTCYGINVASGNNCQVSNNNVGGSGPALSGVWTVSAVSPVVANFVGINVNAGTTTVSRVYNNKVQNFDWKTNAGSTWTGIASGGNSNVGTDGANFVGSNTGNDNIKVTCYSAGSISIYGMNSGGSAGFVENNSIGSITSTLSGAINAGTTIYGIFYQRNQAARNNVIGSITTAQSIRALTTGSTNNVMGVYCNPTAGGNVTVTGNTIANLYNAAAGMNRGVADMNAGGIINISSNLIHTIVTPAGSTGTSTGASIIGIEDDASGTSSTNTIAGNTIYNLVSTAPGAVSVYGILFHSNDGGPVNFVEKNLIHSFITTSPTASQYGIFMDYGTANYRNNVIRLGIDKDGNSITSTAQIIGMNIGLSVGCCVAPKAIYIAFNTVYIGGSGVAAGAVKTYAFQLANHGSYFGPGNGEDIRDNIFVNMRTNAVPNPLNYAISLPVMATSPWICDYNIYQASATDGKLGSVGGVDVLSMGALQEAYPGSDLNSGFGDPLLTAPAAAMATMDLKPQNFTPAESHGIALATVPDDYAGLVRSANTPTDIGAYAGNFTPAGPGQDIWFPVISYEPLGNTSITTGRITYSFATITDIGTGVNTTAGLKPRVYYKKLHDANVFGGNTSADNGWKWVETTSSASPFDFNIDYSIIFGGSVVLGDTLQYFVVAQDLATTPNVSFSPATGASGTSVASSVMVAPATPNKYSIVPLMPALVEIGTGYPYTSLTGTLASGGFFAAMNGMVINQNTVAVIKTDIVEPGTVSLNKVSEEGPNSGTLTLTVQSDGVMHTLSGTTTTATTPLIPITGARRFIIDGGVPQSLTFRNTNASAALTGPVIQYSNASQSCVLMNSILESNASTATSGVVTIGSTGINSVTITGCDIRDARGGTTGSPTSGIYSNSKTNLVNVLANNIYNFKNSATYITAIGINLPLVADGCNISGNSIFMESGMNPVCPLTGIYFWNSGNHDVSTNFIGGQAPLCQGGQFTITGNVTFNGIYYQSTVSSSIQGNTIQAITMSNTGTGVIFYGINTYIGLTTIEGNIIGSPSISNTVLIAGTGTSAGIINSFTSATNSSIIEKNTIANITLTNATGSPVFNALKMTGGTVRQNKVYNIGGSAAAATPVIYGIYNVTGLAANEFSNNMIALDGGVSTNPTLYGIFEASSVAGNTGVYYNSVNIYGTASGAATTAAYYRSGSAPHTANNNIFVNTRTGGTGKHYAILSTPVTGLTSNYNDLYATNTLGHWGAAGAGNDKANLAAWQAIVIAPPLDPNSISVLPAFTANNNLYIVSDAAVASKGTPVSVLVDIDDVVRCNPPDLGINKFGSCTKTINLNLFVEGLYAGAGMMNPAMEFNGTAMVPKWGPTIADQITVELHDAATYATVIYTASNVVLNTDGTATFTIPGVYGGSYYITVKQRNSISAVTAAPVAMADVVSYNFTDLANKTFGSNMKLMSGNKWAMFGGDANADGVVDALDFIAVENDALSFVIGYVLTDLNGDGAVDALDLIIAENNAFNFVSVVTP